MYFPFDLVILRYLWEKGTLEHWVGLVSFATIIEDCPTHKLISLALSTIVFGSILKDFFGKVVCKLVVAAAPSRDDL
jgi:hypothetical protein